MCQRKIAYWVIPPEADAEFAAHMEEVLEVYARPFDSDCPVLCMDEQPVQLVCLGSEINWTRPRPSTDANK